jgi:hypothetical protein
MLCGNRIYAVATVTGYRWHAQRQRPEVNLSRSLAGLKINLEQWSRCWWRAVVTGIDNRWVRDIAYALSFNLLPLHLEDIYGRSSSWLNSLFGVCMMAG